MITPMTIYLITRVDAIRGFLEVALFALGLIIFVTLLVWLNTAIDDGAPKCDVIKEKAWRFTKAITIPCGIVFVISALLQVAIPSSKELCAIVAIPAIAKNDSVNEIGAEIVDLAKDWLNELKPDKGEK